jgi:DNA replication protein DnaC
VNPLAVHLSALLAGLRDRHAAPVAEPWPPAPTEAHFAVETAGEHLRARLLLTCRECADGWQSADGYALRCRCATWRARVEAFDGARLPAGALGHTWEALDRARFAGWPGLRHTLSLAAQGTRGALLTGGCGAGKSHLAAAVLRTAALVYGLPCRWARWPDVLGEMRRAMNEKGADPEQVVDALTRSRRVLVLDELGGERATDWSAEALTRVLSQAIDRRVAVVATSNFSADGLARIIGERSASRLAELAPEARVQADDYRRHRAGGGTT